MKNFFIFIFIVSLGYGCAGSPTPIPETGSADASLFAEKCGACHSVPHPKRHAPKQWRHMLSLMEKEMEHLKMEPLTANEKKVIMGYLERNARE